MAAEPLVVSAAECGASSTAPRGPVLLAERCLTLCRPGMPCDACAQVCPTGAFTLGERSLSLDLDRCLRCGRCGAACPSEALAFEGFADVPEDATRLECSRVPGRFHASSTAVVPCLGGVSPGALRGRLARRGEEPLTIVDRGWCAACPAGGEPEPWHRTVVLLREELHRAGLPERISIVREPLPVAVAAPPPAPTRPLEVVLDRRALFRGASVLRDRLGPPRLAARGEGPPERIDTAALRERAATLAALVGRERLPAALFPDLAIAETCCDRRICAASCPTGALELELADDSSSLAFDPTLCTGCRSCVDVCPTGSLALMPSAEGGLVERRPLRRRALVRCAECGAAYAPPSPSGRCSTCEKDHALMRSVHRWVREPVDPQRPESI